MLQTAEIAYLTKNDHLGSPRINIDRDGDVISRHDYHPFGEEILTTERGNHPDYTPDSVRKQFTGYERDSETHLDFAQARMFASPQGRFTSPDNFSNSTRPQEPGSWNLYVYVLNNPLRFVDPDGELDRDANGNVIFHKTGKTTVKKPLEAVKKNGQEVKINGKTVYAMTSWDIETGYVKTDSGKKIEASKATSSVKTELVDEKGNLFKVKDKDTAGKALLSQTQSDYDNAGFDPTTDCHGTSFASGQVWINNDQVEKLVKGDGYRAITASEAQQGDVAIYSTDGSLDPDKVEHSTTLSSNPGMVTSKGGIMPLQSNIPLGPGPGTAWARNPSAKVTFWTQRAKSP